MALAAGAYPPVWMLLPGLLFLPGSVALSCLAETEVVRLHGRAGEGPGGLSVAFVLSLALLTLGAAPVFVASLPIESCRWGLALVYGSVAVTAMFGPLRSAPWMRRKEPDWSLWAAFGFAVAALLPALWIYAGGTIDDWWDLAVVREWGHAYRAPMTESFLGSGLQHPRWSWNAWLFVQALVVRWGGAEGWSLQAVWLAPLVGMLVVSANAFLAASVFREGRRAILFSIVAVPLWLWGTEALPFFLRVHQDKFVAGLVLVPVLLGAALRELRQRSLSSILLVAAAALACLSVHLLIFTMGAVAVMMAAVGRGSDEAKGPLAAALGGLRQTFPRLLPLLALACLYPIWQGLRLGPLFESQGINLADPSNPVVNAHLWLGRIVAPSSPLYFVDPRAVFGSIAVVAMGGLFGLGTETIRGRDRDEKVLGWLFWVPCLLIFTPLVASVSGAVWVPWMIYRLGWVVPVPLLLGRLFERSYEAPALRLRAGSWQQQLQRIPRPWFVLVAVVTATLVVGTAADRVARDLSEHPRERDKAPRGALAEAYAYLDARQEPGAVLASEGFSTLVPALTGRRVVAFSERGTLVFSSSQGEAYRRLVDRAAFFSRQTTPGQRVRIAADYDVAFAVFPRRWAAPGEEPRWLEASTGLGFVAADPAAPNTPWAEEESLRAAIPDDWRVVWSNAAYWIVRTRGMQALPTSDVIPQQASLAASTWTAAVGVQASPYDATVAAPSNDQGQVEGGDRDGLRQLLQRLRDRPRDSIVAATVGSPGVMIELEPAPLSLGVSDKLIWTTPGAIWDDIEAEATIELELGGLCRVDAVEVVPYLPRGNREVLEFAVGDRVVREQAVHRVPIRLELTPERRQKVRLVVRSILGNPLRLASVWLLGDSRDCEGPVRRLIRPEFVQEQSKLAELFELVRLFPHSARPLIGVARHRYREEPDGAGADILNLLERALHADPDNIVAWLEYGQALDRNGRFDDAADAYEHALTLDSNNAWARGVIAWARYRQGRKLSAVFHSLRAFEADHQYSDALTILAHVADDWRQTAIADRLLLRARRLDPWRSWPVLAASAFASRRGQPELAESILREFLKLHPGDRDVQRRLDLMFGAADAGQG